MMELQNYQKCGKKVLWSLLHVYMHSRGGSLLAFTYNLLLNCMRTYKCTNSCKTFIKIQAYIHCSKESIPPDYVAQEKGVRGGGGGADLMS
jgi:hypothetical protein